MPDCTDIYSQYLRKDANLGDLLSKIMAAKNLGAVLQDGSIPFTKQQEMKLPVAEEETDTALNKDTNLVNVAMLKRHLFLGGYLDLEIDGGDWDQQI